MIYEDSLEILLRPGECRLCGMGPVVQTRPEEDPYITTELCISCMKEITGHLEEYINTGTRETFRISKQMCPLIGECWVTEKIEKDGFEDADR